jgi:O-antigen/teichoic acid export membrane protein
MFNHSAFRYLFGGAISQIMVLCFWSYISSIVSINIVGEFHEIIFWVELISLVSLMGITTYYAKLYYKSTKTINDNLLFLVLFLISLFLALLYVLIDGLFTHIDIIFLSAVFGRMSFDFYSNILVVKDRSLSVVKIQVLRASILLLSGVILAFLNCDSILILIGAYSLSFVLPGLGLFLRSKIKSRTADFSDFNWRIILDSSPYMAVGLVGIFGAYSTRLVAITLFSDETVGIIGLFTSYTAPLLAILAALNKYYYPLSMQSLSSHGRLPLRVRFVTLSVVLFSVMLSFLIYTDLLDLFMPQNIWQYKSIFYGMVILVIPHIAYVYLSPYILYESGKYLLYQNIGYVSVSILLQLLCYSYFGINSIVYVLGLVEVIQLILLLLIISKKSSMFHFNRELIYLVSAVIVCPALVLFSL